jgi:hypothetical protein
MPEGAVYVGRPSPWGNPWKITRMLDGSWAVYNPSGASGRGYLGTFVSEERARYWAVVGFRRDFEENIEPLRGHDLACWCPLDQPCHADVLLELANA